MGANSSYSGTPFGTSGAASCPVGGGGGGGGGGGSSCGQPGGVCTTSPGSGLMPVAGPGSGTACYYGGETIWEGRGLPVCAPPR